MNIVALVKSWIKHHNKEYSVRNKTDVQIQPVLSNLMRHHKSIAINTKSQKLALFALPMLLTATQPAFADGTYMTNMTASLSQASIDQLTDATHTSGAIAGDIVEFVLSADILNQKDGTGDDGPGTYFTAYIPNGVEVVGAWIVSDASGTTSIAPNTAGLASDGWSKRGDTSPYGAPYAATGPGRMNDIYGDTGIFYSTNPITQLYTSDGTNIAIGPIGNPKDTGLSAVLNGIDVYTTSWKQVETFNWWDANQVNAFGSAGAGTTSSTAPVIVSSGGGVTPFTTGTFVAGPQSGYQNDNTGGVGPWNRIQYPGSKIANISDGPATAEGPAPFSGDVLDASSMGVALSDSSPLPSSTNAVRWSAGFGDDGTSVYVKIRLRLTNTVLSATDGVVLNFTANGSDSIKGGSKDNHWRYHAPTTASTTAFFFEKQIIKVNGVDYTGGDIAADSLITYQLRYLNLGNLPTNNISLTDDLSNQINVSGCSAGFPTLSNISAGVTASVSGGSTDCPSAGATLTFNNLPNVSASGRLDGLRGGTFTYDIRIEDTLADGTAITNSAAITGDDPVTGLTVPVTATSTVNIGAPPEIADISVTKTLDTTGLINSGDTVTYTIVVSNSATSANAATNVVVEDIPTNLTITSVSSTNCSSFPCTIPSLAIGASETITVLATAP